MRQSATPTASTASAPIRTVPGPPPLPLVGGQGNVVQFFGDPINYMGRAFGQYGPIVSLAEGARVGFLQRSGQGIVLVHGPALTREVQSQTDLFYVIGEKLSKRTAQHRDSPRQRALQALSVHVFSLNGEQHRRHRRLLAPPLHKKHIETYHADMVSLTQRMLDRWAAGEPRDIRLEMSRLTLQVVVRTLFGELGGINDDLGASMTQAMHLTIPGMLLPVDLPGSPYRRWGMACQHLQTVVQELIDQRRGDLAGEGEGNDLLSVLIQARDEDGSALSDVELIGSMFAIFLAGHETSANALMWALFLLSQHPRYAADLITELDDLLHGAPPTLAQMNQVPLLECTIKESLRLMPPVPFSVRYAAKDTELGGYPIQAGADVIVSIYHTHRMPELYEQPYAFNPYRWIGIERDVFEFTPFNSGPRMCLGAALAMQEMKLVLAMVLQRYRLEFVPGTRVDRFVSFGMSVKKGLPMIVRKQDRRFAEGVGGARGNVREMVSLPD